jgi:outer membrane protein
MRRFCKYLLLSLALTGFAAPLAQAQPADQDPNARSKSIIVGGSIGVRPKYEGSDEFRVIGVPIIIPKFSGGESNGTFSMIRRRVKFRNVDDIRFTAIEWGGLQFGPLAGYNFGRDQDDALRLRGLGDVDGGVTLGGFVGYDFGTLLVDGAYIQQATGDDTGYQLRFAAGVEQEFSPNIKVVTRIGTTFASDSYMDSYFGVSPTQSARSFTAGIGLPVFDASSGIKDVYGQIDANINLTERWLLRTGLRYGRLLGDAEESPVIETPDQFSGGIGLGYKFHLSR